MATQESTSEKHGFEACPAEVHLRLDNRADVEVMRWVSRVPGVVGVHSQLAWTEDDTEC